MRPPTRTLDARGWAMLCALGALWSISFVFIKISASSIPILTLVLIRFGLAAIALHVLVAATGRPYPRGRALLARFALMGVLNNVVPGVLMVYATPRIGAGAAAILNATAPIFALLLAHMTTADEKLDAAKVVGILLGLGGVVALSGPQALAGATSETLAILAMLLGTFFYGVAAIVGRSFAGIDPVVSATSQLTASTAILLPLALLVERPWEMPVPPASALLAAAALALASTALAYVIFFALLTRAGATNALLVTLLIPVGGVVLAWLMLGETLSPGEGVGLVLIALGLAVIDGRALRRLFGSGEPVRPDSC